MGNSPNNKQFQTVSKLDLNRYVGKNEQSPKVWFELYSKPNWFQKGYTNVSATYYMKKDGKVMVINRGTTPSGRQKEATGTATLVPCNPTYNCSNKSRFSVKFSIFQPDSLKTGNYLILDIVDSKDPQQYDYALVTDATGEMVWILGKNKNQLPNNIKKRFFDKLHSYGVETYNLIATRTDN